MAMFEKCETHQPLNGQGDRYASGGRGDQSLDARRPSQGVRGRTRAAPPADRGARSSAERLHGEDTTVPVLAKTKTHVGRLWTYVCDDRPFEACAASCPVPPIRAIVAPNIR